MVSKRLSDTIKVPFRWNSLSVSGGVGWDFFITPELKLRPIFNFALGQVAFRLA